MSQQNNPASVEQNRQIVEAFLQAMQSGDVAHIVDAYHQHATLQTMGNTLISGSYNKQQIKEFAGGIFDAFPNGLSYQIHHLIAEQDRVAVEASVSGQHASGQLYNNDLHFLFTLLDGKILSLKEYLDTEKVTAVLCGGQRPD